MDSALESIVKSAAGTGGPTKPSSRYYGAQIETFTSADGTGVVYLRRRIIPQPEIYSTLQDYVVVDGDRLDNLAATAFNFEARPAVVLVNTAKIHAKRDSPRHRQLVARPDRAIQRGSFECP